MSGALMCFALSVQAGITTDTVKSILIFEGGNLIYVYPTNGVTSPPSCHGSNGNYYSFSMGRPLAKSYLAALMTAQAMGYTVNFFGTGTGTDQSVSETLSYINITKP
jgi:hypothetical protein